MKITFKILILGLLSVTQLNAQDLNSFKAVWPTGYVISDVNDNVGPGIMEDFDGDGAKDVACLLYEKKNGSPIFFIYLTSKPQTAKYCDWVYMMHDLTYNYGVLSIASDSGGMGIFGSMKLKYDRVKRDLVVFKTDGVKGVRFNTWKILGK
jgi:hypothetical protein